MSDGVSFTGGKKRKGQAHRRTGKYEKMQLHIISQYNILSGVKKYEYEKIAHREIGF